MNPIHLDKHHYSNCKVLCFDLDDTLWPLKETIIKAEQETYNWLCNNASQITENFSLNDFIAIRNQLYITNVTYQTNVSQVRIDCYKKLAIESGYDEKIALSLATEAFHVFYGHRQNVNCFDGVEDTLKQLGNHFLIGAITNGNANLDTIPIGQHFSFCVSAESCGHSKPDVNIFNAAFLEAQKALSNNKSKIELKREEILHVGDDYERDYLGALNAGFKALWLGENEENDEVKKISSVNQLHPLIELVS